MSAADRAGDNPGLAGKAPPRRVALALGGGAALGWAHIGVIRALQEAGVAIGAIAGTSVGAMVAACHAAGKLDVLEALARGARRRTMFAYLDPSFARGALLGGRGIAREMRSHLGEATRIEDLAIPTSYVTADLMTGDEVRLTRGPLLPAVRASIAIPSLFRPVAIDGRYLVDGGMVANVPLGAARAIAPTLPLIAVDLFADYAGHVTEAMPRGLPRHAFGTARSAFMMMMRAQGKLAAALDPPAVHLAPAIGHRSTGDFHEAEDLIAAGHRVALAAMPQIRAAAAA